MYQPNGILGCEICKPRGSPTSVGVTEAAGCGVGGRLAAAGTAVLQSVERGVRGAGQALVRPGPKAVPAGAVAQLTLFLEPR